MTKRQKTLIWQYNASSEDGKLIEKTIEKLISEGNIIDSVIPLKYTTVYNPVAPEITRALIIYHYVIQ